MHTKLGGITPVRNGKNAETRTLRNSSSMNQTVLATKNLKMTELLVISPYFCMFYILYAIRNTLYATRYMRIEFYPPELARRRRGGIKNRATIYAKQSQFTKYSNEPKPGFNRGL